MMLLTQTVTWQSRQQNKKFDYKMLCICFRQEKLLPDISQCCEITHYLIKGQSSLWMTNLSSGWISIFLMKFSILLFLQSPVLCSIRASSY